MANGLWNKLRSAFTGDPDESPKAEATPSPAPELPRPVTVIPAAATSTGGLPRPVHREETPESLERSLKWRAEVLYKRARIEDPGGDGRALVEFLLLGADEVIRQIPQAAQKALSVSRDPNSTTHDMVVLFENDPTLTQALLQRANSFWYRRGNDVIVSITQGIQRVGCKGVENLFLENIARGLLCRPGNAYKGMVSTVWDHLLTTAVTARMLAPVFKVDADTAHALALLHDIGKLVIFDRISEMRSSLRREVEITGPFLNRILEHLHEPLAGQAAMMWGMGDEVSYAVAHHHRKPTPDVYEPYTELLFVADRLDHVIRASGEPDWEAIWSDGEILTPRAGVEAAFRDVAALDRPADGDTLAA